MPPIEDEAVPAEVDSGVVGGPPKTPNNAEETLILMDHQRRLVIIIGLGASLPTFARRGVRARGGILKNQSQRQPETAGLMMKMTKS